MCTNFIPTASDKLVQFGIERAPFDYKAETWPGYDAPIVINIVRKDGAAAGTDDTQGESEGAANARTKRECFPTRFGLIPLNISAEDVKSFARKWHTNSAHSETASQRRSFRNAWKKQQYCLIPVSSFYEPNRETGWLNATPEEAFRMCQQYPAELMDSAAAPKPHAAPKMGLPPEDEAE